MKSRLFRELSALPFNSGIRRICACALLIGASIAGIATVQAQIAIPSTRVVYAAPQKEVVVPIRNMGDAPVLVQAWISDGDPDQPPEASKAPFVLAPPVVRLDAGKDNHLRIRGIEGVAPNDNVEHLYWLNILAIPPRVADATQGVLELAIRSRYKVLYRPKGLPAPGLDRTGEWDFSLKSDGEGRRLHIANRSAYVANLGTLTVVHDGRSMELDNPYVLPMAGVDVELPSRVEPPLEVQFHWIDDEGRLHPGARSIGR